MKNNSDGLVRGEIYFVTQDRSRYTWIIKEGYQYIQVQNKVLSVRSFEHNTKDYHYKTPTPEQVDLLNSSIQKGTYYEPPKYESYKIF